MPLVKLVRGARYQFENTLVLNGEVIEVDPRTRNRIVRSGHFIDVAEHERPVFTPMAEDDEPTEVRGGKSLDEIDDDPGLTGAKEGGVTVRRRGKGSDVVNQRAEERRAEADAEEEGEAEEVAEEAV